MTEANMNLPGPKIRVITPIQLQEGFYSFDNGFIMHHEYRIVKKLDNGNYVVEDMLPVLYEP